ncbi:MAG: hypothetical protein Q8S21_00390 [Candidatus Paracaedibacteraceae bacterium]|nr:hypothetical protein [Candidatus Paracaedibacteraceae bacterium]
MTIKTPKLRVLTVLSVQLFCFWLAVGYVSCFFVLSIPASAQDIGVGGSFALPHKQLFIYAQLTTVASITFAMITFWVQKKTAKLQLIRLYRSSSIQNKYVQK